jgi:putative hydrolase of the HAD superfamily
MTKLITFDLWDTVFIDDSDEPKRKAKGLAPKFEERRNLVEKALGKTASLSREMIEIAYATADEAFRHVWYQQNVTWSVAERLGIVFKGLNSELPESEFNEVVRQHEEMELDIPPDLAPDIKTALIELNKHYQLAVISDTIFSPGRVLKQILAGHGLLDLFDVFVFSDEIGCSKPNPAVFDKIVAETGVEYNEIIHIGDREKKDVDGAHLVGAKAILTTVVKDRGSSKSQAEAICNDYSKLVDIISSL